MKRFVISSAGAKSGVPTFVYEFYTYTQ